jgi:hypothetical protein
LTRSPHHRPCLAGRFGSCRSYTLIQTVHCHRSGNVMVRNALSIAPNDT